MSKAVPNSFESCTRADVITPYQIILTCSIKFLKFQEANLSLQEEITKITEDGRKKVNELLKINEDLEQDKDTEISRLRNILEDGGARGDTTLGKFNFF